MTHAAPISVVIPCYRCADTIDRALTSVLVQTLPVAEIILVDDASPDDTLPALHRQQQRASAIRVLSARVNAGAGVARNLGWDEATQPWVAFLDADDAWHPRKIELQYAAISSEPDTVLSSHATRLAAESVWELSPALIASARNRRVSAALLPFLNVIPTRSVVIKRDAPFRFYPDKRYAEDFALWLRLVRSGAPTYKLELPLACSFRPEYSGGGASAKLWRHERGELDALRQIRDEGLMSPLEWAASSLLSVTKFGVRVLRRGRL